MRSFLLIIALFTVGPAIAADPIPVGKLQGWSGPIPEKAPCECRSKDGTKVGLGAKMCLKRGDELVTMQCRLVLNNTAWQRVGEGCDVAMN